MVKVKAADDLESLPSKLQVATVALTNMTDMSSCSDTAPTIVPNGYITTFADLPPEVLIMICTHLQEGFFESCPKAPQPPKRRDEEAGTVVYEFPLARLDMQRRDLSFFAAFQVNQSMRNACRVAFSSKTILVVGSDFTAIFDFRVRLEERTIRKFDRIQKHIEQQERLTASNLAVLQQKQQVSTAQGQPVRNGQNIVVEETAEQRTDRLHFELTDMEAAVRVDSQYKQAYHDYDTAKQYYEDRYKLCDPIEFGKEFGLVVEACRRL